jgi:hypothetical protein
MRILENIYDAPSIRPIERTANGEHVIARKKLETCFSGGSSLPHSDEPLAQTVATTSLVMERRMWTTVVALKLGDLRAVTRKKGHSEIEHVVDSTRKIGNMN